MMMKSMNPRNSGKSIKSSALVSNNKNASFTFISSKSQPSFFKAPMRSDMLMPAWARFVIKAFTSRGSKNPFIPNLVSTCLNMVFNSSWLMSCRLGTDNTSKISASTDSAGMPLTRYMTIRSSRSATFRKPQLPLNRSVGRAECHKLETTIFGKVNWQLFNTFWKTCNDTSPVFETKFCRNQCTKKLTFSKPSRCESKYCLLFLCSSKQSSNNSMPLFLSGTSLDISARIFRKHSCQMPRSSKMDFPLRSQMPKVAP
mmetsp:Transcript_100377/g.289893  ORF Transcript_100377/g.289893 Transcript_100377/m.289893 type:complete len:257 (-) Transcript_100377:371-1141(-)